MQTQTWLKGSNVTYPNFVRGISSLWGAEGLRGLYRGIGPAVVGSIPASCLYFTCYEMAKVNLGGDSLETPFFVNFAAGMIAETLSCVIWVPVDVIKERMQIQHVPRGLTETALKKTKGDGFYTGGLDAIRSIVRTEGFVGFYRGYGATVMSFGPFSALYFMFYEELKIFVDRTFYGRRNEGFVASEMPFGSFILCGASAGAAASFCTNPLDIVKLRLQVQRQANVCSTGQGNAVEVYRNMFDGLGKLVRADGVRGLFRGAGARMAFHAPATAINMALFETFKVLTYKHL